VSIFVVVLFLIIVVVSVITSKIPFLILGLYIATSLLTFILYALDKSAARKGHWRTPESTLHLLSLAGGWPGAIAAQQKLRHKSKKQSFRMVFRVTVFLNSGAFFCLLTPKGTIALESFIDSKIYSVLKLPFQTLFQMVVDFI